MTLHESKTAIIIFSLSEEEERKNKPFMTYKNLGQALCSDVFEKVKRTKLPYFVHDETLQIGNSFGEKITYAIDSTFKKGFDNVIIVGNDTPELNLSLLNKADRAVRQGKVVYGHSADNGIYLLALNTKNFDSAAVIDLPWQTNRLSNALEVYLNCFEIPFLRLKTLRDIDTIQDFDMILHSSFQKLSFEIRCILIAFLSSLVSFYYFIKNKRSLLYKLPSGTRGSPTYLSF